MPVRPTDLPGEPLFVGYGNNDPCDLDLVFKINSSLFKDSARKHYALMVEPGSNATPAERDYLRTIREGWDRDFNIKVIPYSDHDDLPAILRDLRSRKDK